MTTIYRWSPTDHMSARRDALRHKRRSGGKAPGVKLGRHLDPDAAPSRDPLNRHVLATRFRAVVAGAAEDFRFAAVGDQWKGL